MGAVIGTGAAAQLHVFSVRASAEPHDRNKVSDLHQVFLPSVVHMSLDELDRVAFTHASCSEALSEQRRDQS